MRDQNAESETLEEEKSYKKLGEENRFETGMRVFIKDRDHPWEGECGTIEAALESNYFTGWWIELDRGFKCFACSKDLQKMDLA